MQFIHAIWFVAQRAWGPGPHKEQSTGAKGPMAPMLPMPMLYLRNLVPSYISFLYSNCMLVLAVGTYVGSLTC